MSNKKGVLRWVLIVLGVFIMTRMYYAIATERETAPVTEAASQFVETTMTSEPIPMPEQVGFDQVCQTKKPVLVEGLLHIPESVRCSTDEWGNFCTVELTDLVTRSSILLRLPVAGEREEPVPNHMLELSIPYEETDFMVAVDAGGWVGEGSVVHVATLVEPLGYASDAGYHPRPAQRELGRDLYYRWWPEPKVNCNLNLEIELNVSCSNLS